MIRFVALTTMFLAGLTVPSLPVMAASFDCSKAGTPFEHAICDSDELSAADERLSRTYATAAGGLSDAASGDLRSGQREWLTYAQRACTMDAEPMTSGKYGEEGVSCLVDLFKSRAQVLETSRMIQGLRFYPMSQYEALPDPENKGDAYWGVAEHELSIVQLDGDEPFAAAFNALVRAERETMQGGDEDVASHASSDTSNSISVKEVAGTGRITLDVSTYWYGHGAAHGNYTLSYLHFLTDEARFLKAEDFFTGKKWKQALSDLTIAALEREHGENLMMDGTEYIEDTVADPTSWDLSNPYGLVIQFQPYQVAAYAYGAPTATVSWDDLEPYLTEGSNSIRFGF
ncbi:DUF3298 domain-containing protein [Devosia aurantiaca]|uniref:DUF1311 domain-containing protein n=1 Tax=Devosia aurantiaca TaxID=2714858 RepID=A0A6M1SQJ0_9HYPH|nr:DUF3298 domain-containing protein [Devosia aurantiaca]NGP19420.1 DUF1311 domain-containing protein [Devosia aurantiaca]